MLNDSKTYATPYDKDLRLLTKGYGYEHLVYITTRLTKASVGICWDLMTRSCTSLFSDQSYLLFDIVVRHDAEQYMVRSATLSCSSADYATQTRRYML
jgi:predicted amidohydrolase